MVRRVIICMLTGVGLSACVGVGGMIPGHLYSDKGQMLEFAIEKAYRTGGVTAFNPKTNERFSGKYVGILEEISSSSSAFASAGRFSASGFSNSSISSNVANATAFLQGDKGTLLSCRMQIEAGLNPHGFGSCEDNKGSRYRLQF